MKTLVKHQIATINPKQTHDVTLSNDKTLLDILEDFLADNTKAKQLIGLLARQSI